MLGGAADGSGRCKDATTLSFTSFLAHNAFSRQFSSRRLSGALRKIDKFFETTATSCSEVSREMSEKHPKFA
jgi:hypothetical protein